MTIKVDWTHLEGAPEGWQCSREGAVVKLRNINSWIRPGESYMSAVYRLGMGL